MKAPVATFKTALAAGAALSVLMCGVDWANRTGICQPIERNPFLGVVFAVLFFVSTLCYVVDVRNIAPEALRTRIPFFYFPTDRRGLELLSDVMARMFVWFVAAALVMVIYWRVLEWSASA